MRTKFVVLAVLLICLATTSGTSAQGGLPSVLDLLLGKATGQQASTPSTTTPAVEPPATADVPAIDASPWEAPAQTTTPEAPSTETLVPEPTPTPDAMGPEATPTPEAQDPSSTLDALAAAAAAAAAAANGGSAPSPPLQEVATPSVDAPMTEPQLPQTETDASAPVTDVPTIETGSPLPVEVLPPPQAEAPVPELSSPMPDTVASTPPTEAPTTGVEVPTATPPTGETPAQPEAPTLTPTPQLPTPAPSTNPEPTPAVPVPATSTPSAPEATPPTQASSPAPGAPPSDWAGLKKDVALVFEMELRGKYVVPWTSPKSYVVSKVLVDHYFQSAQLSDMTVQLLNTFTYLTYELDTRRRSLLSGRSLLQQEMSGVALKVAMITNRARTDSEITSLMDGIMSETLAADITDAGVPLVNVTLTDGPKVMGIDQVNPQPTESSSGIQGWAIGLIVAAVLLVVPVPLYFLIRSHRRRRKEAIARQQAEQAVARARAQSRIVKPKSFTLSQGGSIHNINVRTGMPPGSFAGSQYRAGSVRSLYSQGSLPGIQRQGSMHSQGGQSTRSARIMNSPASYPVGLPQSFTSQPSPRTALGSPDSVREGSLGIPSPQGVPRMQRTPSAAPHDVVEIHAYLEDSSRPSPRR